MNLCCSCLAIVIASAMGTMVGINGFHASSAVAQMTPDATLPNNSQVNQVLKIFNITGGSQAGGNLFHSFKEFSVPTGSEALFNNGTEIQNILTRVTGKSISNIDGLIKANGSANLFLMNPNGIVFGEKARLDIGGSFLATSASNMKFSDGSEFSAVNPQAPPLLKVNITPGLQYGTSQPEATIRSTGDLVSKQDLTLVADNLELSGRLNSGRNLNISSVSGSLANINSVNTPIFSALGDVNIAANYTGASLLVEAKKNIRFGGEITITQPGTGLQNGRDTETLSNSSALILRSGQNTLVYGDNALLYLPVSSSLDIPQGITIVKDVVLKPFKLVGGTVNIEAGNGDITTNLISTNGQKFPSLDLSKIAINANGGAISLNAAKGSISTGNLLSYSSFLSSRTSNDGGAITLDAGANINTGILSSFSRYDFSTSGNGGAITLSAGKNINTEALNSLSISITSNASTGGAITLNAGANINTQSLSSASTGRTAGNGGAITLSAGDNINTQSLSSASNSFASAPSFYSGYKAGNGGAITLSAGANINTESLDSFSRSSYGVAGSGGGITLSAGDTIDLNSNGSINSSGATGSGNITISSNAPFVFNNGVVSSDTLGDGKAGDIQIGASSISLANGAQLSASTHSTGASGNITLVASDTVELSGETTDIPRGIFTPQDSSNAIGLPPDTYLGGYIPNGTTSKPSEGTVFPSGVFSQTTTNSTGSAGNLKIETGKLIINNGAAIATTSFGKNSNAGSVSINARDSITIDNGSILSGVAPGAIGNSGKVELITPLLSITNSGIVQTQTLGDGFAGEILVDADTVSISGKDSALRSASGGTNELLKGTPSSRIGQGGNINVTANNLQVTDGAVLDATTVTDSIGGDITVNANTLSIGSGQILTSTNGAGDAGNLTIQPHSNEQNLKVNFQNAAQISASTSSSGEGGSLTIKAPESITLAGDGSIISAETTGAGNGGDLTLSTGKFVAQDGAQVTVSSLNSGKAGNLTVDANSIELNNRAKINADTTGGGGNIFVNSPLLLLRRGSSITTNASGDNISGGDITIDGKNGFIVALPWENSDIRADSENFRGGNVTIKNTAGIYGIQSRKEPSPQTSDITVKGATPDLEGNIQINQPELDPTNGLTELPINLVDASNQISNACTPGAQSQNTFVSTGRGGLPMNPTQPLQETNTLQTWVKLKPQSQTNTRIEQQPRIVSNNNKVPGIYQIVEATGWIVDKDGNIEFVAQANQINLQSKKQTSASCSVSK